MVTQHGEATVRYVIGKCIWNSKKHELHHKAGKLLWQEDLKTYIPKVRYKIAYAEQVFKSNYKIT